MMRVVAIRPPTYLLPISLLLFFTCTLSNRHLIPTVHATDWDVLIFTQNWPVSVCLSWEIKGKNHTCLPTQSNSFWTIHGIWPTKFGTIGPTFCNTSNHFNPQGIYGIEKELENVWAPIEKHKNKYAFWKHEWEKHGTCAAKLEEFSTEFDYFRKGIQWHKEYDMVKILDKAGVIPGKSQNITEVWNSVKQVLGKNPFLSCFTHPSTKTAYLLEVRICFDKNLTLVNCDGIKKRCGKKCGENNLIECPTTKLVEFPLAYPYPPPAFANQKRHYLFDILRFLQLVSWMTS